MSQVSPRQLTVRSKGRIKEVFLDALLSLKSRQEVEKLFETFFTATEKVNLPKRFGVFLLLTKGDDYDIIRQKLKVSNATIASVQKQIHIHGVLGIEKTIRKVISENKPEQEYDPDPLLGRGKRALRKKAIQRPYWDLPY